MKNIVIVVIIIILVIIGGYFIYKGAYPSKTQEGVGSQVPSGQQGGGTGGGGQQAEEPREIKVLVTEFAFSPPLIEVKAGERIKLVLTNVGTTPHDFKIKQVGFEIATDLIQPTETTTLEFVAPDVGEYTFICSLPGHLESGMYGKLKVTE